MRQQRKAIRKLRALQWIQSVRVVRLQPEDVVVLQADTRLSQLAESRICEHLKRLFPKNQSIVLDAGLRLSKVTKTEASDLNQNKSK